MKLSSREEAGLAAFLGRQKSDPRYRFLLGLERWSDPEMFRPSRRAQYASTVEEPPNAQLGALLTALVGRSLAHELGQQPALRPYRYALLGVADGRCGAVAEFFPGASWSSLQSRWHSFTREVTRAQAVQAQSKERRLVEPLRFDGKSQRSGAPEIMGLGFLVKQVSDIGASRWTTALEPGSYDLPQSAAVALRDGLLKSAENDEPELTEASALAAVSGSARYCEYLQRRSRVAIGGSPGSGAPVESSVAAVASHMAGSSRLAPELLRLCASCHESGVGPSIPFTDPESLARELHFRAAPHGTLLGEVLFRLSPEAGAARMPLGITLSDSERTQLHNYFSELTNETSMGGARSTRLGDAFR